MELKELLYKIAVEKQYEYIDEVMQMPQVWSLIWSKIKNYKYKKEEVKNIALFKIKEAILSEYKYEENGTEGKFINFLKNRPLARIYETISWEVFNIRVPKKRNGKKKKPKDENPEISTDNDIIFDLNQKINEFELVEERLELISAIKQLEPEEQNIIYMKFYDDKSDQEIANELNQPRETIRDKRNKALEKMKMFLSN
ncbi:MAG: sigma-70 family RNA polymerase sigma factor [Bacteroidota bacterium]|nr:sigma-70 family RNA polymerase sigma factor [Bacteroidota bacterium]